ncbi:hypothetical protein AXFE_07250 [Acidithrix ferrooxidans]|uniref:Uncharacterized protein n=1 Tax=Acidithrix ferrooxidans TaxID=1280514 RepID=A0A0D8HKR6_9ACTN|nr:hypothetical protein AXFE_07250 [Acidithrix ferrooxidans]
METFASFSPRDVVVVDFIRKFFRLHRREGIVGIFLAVLLIGVVFANSASSRVLVKQSQFVPSFSVSPVASDSSTWYCSLPQAKYFGKRSLSLVLTNTSKFSQTASIYIYSKNAKAKHLKMKIPGGSLRRFGMRGLYKSATGVSADFTGGADLVSLVASLPSSNVEGFCQPSPGPTWIVQGFNTVSASKGFLSIFNPFATDAIVDISFVTPTGPVDPGPLQAVVVPAFSSIDVRLADWFQNTPAITASIQTRIGRIVAGGFEVRSDSKANGMVFASTTPEIFANTDFPLLVQTANQSVDLNLENLSSSQKNVLISIKTLSAQTTVKAPAIGHGAKVSTISETVPPQSSLVVPLKAVASVPVGSFFFVRVHSNYTVAALATLAGSDLGPLNGYFIESGYGSYWPSWLSMLDISPFGAKYNQLALYYGGGQVVSARGSQTALFSKAFVDGQAPSSKQSGIDANAGIGVVPSPSSVQLFPTTNSVGFPDLFTLRSSAPTEMALAYVTPEGSIIPIPSIPLD